MADATHRISDNWLQDLVVRPGDAVWRHPQGDAPPAGPGPVYFVVLHRSHELWTHVYKVEKRRGEATRLVWLLRALPGDQSEHARRWVAGLIPS
ncbi:MAG TPA: hypothetical protein VED40_22530 [Azospirillaceae bacterium]|nr:hypothetical protein [Azospirillaceae bacterium]